MKITQDMLTYDEEAVIVTVDGREYRVTLEDDLDSSIDDADCYSEEDIAAWRNDVWNYVGVIVTPLSVPESKQFELSDSLWGVEFDFPLQEKQTIDGVRYFDTGMDYMVMVHPVPDMIDGVIANVKAYELETAVQTFIYG